MYNAAWYLLLLGIFEFTLVFGEVRIFTAEGIISTRLKLPEPIIAQHCGGYIEVSYKAQLANDKTIKKFKATPKNLAVFGRFFPQEDTVPPAECINS